MRASVLLICLFFFMVGCTRNDQVDPTSFPLSVTMGGKRYALHQKVYINENCNDLFLTTFPVENDQFPFILDLRVSKKGEILKLGLADITRNYESAVFNPKQYLTLSAYSYDQPNSQVSFKLSGTLFNPTTLDTVHIQSEFNQLRVAATSCQGSGSDLTGDLLSADGQKQPFICTTTTSEASQSTIRYYFYSNNGFRILFDSQAIGWALPKGSYPLSTSSPSGIKVQFHQYGGLSNRNNFYKFVETEWQGYRVEGRLEIIEHLISPSGYGVTNGQLTLTAYDARNMPIYQLSNGAFQLVDLIKK